MPTAVCCGAGPRTREPGALPYRRCLDGNTNSTSTARVNGGQRVMRGFDMGRLGIEPRTY
jgi:hypothetical protein